MGTSLKTKRCAVCKAEYLPWNTLQRACGVSCAMEFNRLQDAKAAEKRAREQRRSDRERRDEIKTARDWTREAQAAFNRYIRIRDTGKPCICCGRYPEQEALTGGNWDAGHYRSTGAASHLRFNLHNVHGQLKSCNRFLSGNAVDYRLGLIQRLGQDVVERLECDNAPRKFSIKYLRRIKRIFARRARTYLKLRGLT